MSSFYPAQLKARVYILPYAGTGNESFLFEPESSYELSMIFTSELSEVYSGLINFPDDIVNNKTPSVLLSIPGASSRINKILSKETDILVMETGKLVAVCFDLIDIRQTGLGIEYQKKLIEAF